MELAISAVNNKACKGDVVNFTCSADANPAVSSYQLFENDTAILDTCCKNVEQDVDKWRSLFLQMCG